MGQCCFALQQACWSARRSNRSPCPTRPWPIKARTGSRTRQRMIQGHFNTGPPLPCFSYKTPFSRARLTPTGTSTARIKYGILSPELKVGRTIEGVIHGRTQKERYCSRRASHHKTPRCPAGRLGRCPGRGWRPLQPWPPITSILSIHTTPPQNTVHSSWRPKPAWGLERCA